MFLNFFYCCCLLAAAVWSSSAFGTKETEVSRRSKELKINCFQKLHNMSSLKEKKIFTFYSYESMKENKQIMKTMSGFQSKYYFCCRTCCGGLDEELLLTSLAAVFNTPTRPHQDDSTHQE